MKVEDYGLDITTFRTSRVCSVLGSLFFLAGIGILFQLLAGKYFYSLPSFCVFCLVISGLFFLAGLVLITYKKTVRIHKIERKVVLSESSILGMRTTAFHFDEIMNIELTKDGDCILKNHATLWMVKVYLQHEHFAVEKVFVTVNPSEAKQAAESLAFIAGKELVISCRQEERLILSKI
jgi:hypothetical protein